MDQRDLAKLMSAFAPAPSAKKPAAKKTPRDFVLEWLAHLTPKDASGSFTWEDYLQDFYTHPEKAPEWASEHKIRFAVTLRSREDIYLVVIKEARDSEQFPVFIISVSVPRSDDEIMARTKVQKMYGPASDTVPKRPVEPLQTIWVESFDLISIESVLARTGLAILRWELRVRNMKRPGLPVEQTPPPVHVRTADDHILPPDVHGSILSHQAQAALMTSLPGDFPERGESHRAGRQQDDHDDSSSLPE